jgi:hypothetical protein
MTNIPPFETHDDLPFEPAIAAAARAIESAVAAGENDAFEHAWQIADAVENLLGEWFPDLLTANALDPSETVDKLLEFYAAIHGDTGQANPKRAVVPATSEFAP